MGDEANNKDTQAPEIDQIFLSSPLYKKWGIGDKQTYTPQERIYFSKIPEFDEALKIYNSIDVSKERQFLAEFNKEYGKSPNIDDLALKHPEFEGYFQGIKILTGHKVLDDRDKVFLKTLVEPYISALQMATQK